MDTNQKPQIVQIVIMGQSRSGKTSFCRSFKAHQFVHYYDETLGAEFHKKQRSIYNHKMHLTFWDISGNSKYNSIGRVYLRGCDHLLLFYDTQNKSSYFDIKRWLRLAQEGLDWEKTNVSIVGTKIDQKLKKKITKERIAKDFGHLKCRFFEISSLTKEGVEEVLSYLAQRSYKSPKEMLKEKHLMNLD